MTNRRLAAIAIAIALLWLGAGAIGVATAPKEPTRIEEDSPNWDCHTMGNHICGLTP